jgi:transcriptional regulator with XRE-family HTH domain
MEKQVHLGNNIKSIRELKNMKQDTLADLLGPEWTQKKVSQLEAKAEIDDPMLEQVAKALDVPIEALKTFSVDKTIQIFKNDFTGNAVLQTQGNIYFPTFNPIDKLMQVMDENKKLYEELLKSEREKVAMLERLLEKK